MEILFISDYVCPYCLVGKEALRRGLERLGLKVSITYCPLELTPESEPAVDTYHDMERRKRYKILEEPCKELGLEEMKIPPKVIPRPYTRLAYEAWMYADERGKGEEFNDRMYQAYFMEEKNIGDVRVLVQEGKRLGFDSADLEKALQEGRYTKQEKKAANHTLELLNGNTGILPTIIINGHIKQFHHYTVEEAVDMLLGEEKNGAESFGCGVDGCC